MNKVNSIKNKIVGPIFSVITPFKKDESIDYNSLKSYLKFLYNRGARVFYVMFYNSRLGLLKEKEIVELNIFIAKYLKKNFKNTIIIGAEPYHCSTSRTIDIIKKFKKNRIDLISLLFGEKYYSDNQIIKHFKKISISTNMKLLLHQQLLENGISNNPPVVPFSINALKKISKMKNFVAMKEDAKIDFFTKKILDNTKKNINMVTSGGGKEQWLKFAKFGCHAWLSGISNLDPKIAIKFYEFYKSNNIEKCKKIIEHLEKPFFKIKNQIGWHLTIKASLHELKLMKKYERMPMTPLDESQMKKVKKMILLLKKNAKKYFKEYDFFSFK